MPGFNSRQGHSHSPRISRSGGFFYLCPRQPVAGAAGGLVALSAAWPDAAPTKSSRRSPREARGAAACLFTRGAEELRGHRTDPPGRSRGRAGLRDSLCKDIDLETTPSGFSGPGQIIFPRPGRPAQSSVGSGPLAILSARGDLPDLVPPAGSPPGVRSPGIRGPAPTARGQRRMRDLDGGLDPRLVPGA